MVIMIYRKIKKTKSKIGIWFIGFEMFKKKKVFRTKKQIAI